MSRFIVIRGKCGPDIAYDVLRIGHFDKRQIRNVCPLLQRQSESVLLRRVQCVSIPRLTVSGTRSITSGRVGRPIAGTTARPGKAEFETRPGSYRYAPLRTAKERIDPHRACQRGGGNWRASSGRCGHSNRRRRSRIQRNSESKPSTISMALCRAKRNAKSGCASDRALAT